MSAAGVAVGGAVLAPVWQGRFVSEASSKIQSNLNRYTLMAGEYRYDSSGVPSVDVPSGGSDRILITLLALNLILLAFFVVLNAASSFDTERVRAVAASARTTIFSSFEERDRAEALSYRGALSGFRDSVADQFASVLPSSQDESSVPTVRVGSDRVEVDVPATIFFRNDGTLYDPLPTLDGLAAVIGTPPEGYRAELAIRGSGAMLSDESLVDRLAVLADNLVSRGIPATALSAGVLSNTNAAQSVSANSPSLRFTFFLQSVEEDSLNLHGLSEPRLANEETGR